MKIRNETKGAVDFALAGIAPSGRMDIAAFANGVRRIVSEPDYYRCEFKNENPWNALSGYEVLLTQRRRDAERAEAFVAIEPLLKGQTSNRATLEARLAAAAEKGYDGLLLRGHIVLESLAWDEDGWTARLKLPDGTRRACAGTVDGQAPFMVEY